MTQEDFELLKIDLSARAPYLVKVQHEDSVMTILCVNPYGEVYPDRVNYTLPLEECKPYLRPLSSMTFAEKEELSKNYVWKIGGGQIQIRYHSEGYWDDDTDCPTEEYIKLFEWLNAHHFDYRGLIPMGLALEAPEGMYKSE